MHKFDLKDKTAVITGGAQGFGLDIAKKFLLSGAKVFIWDIDENELSKASKEINNQNLNHYYKFSIPFNYSNRNNSYWQEYSIFWRQRIDL